MNNQGNMKPEKLTSKAPITNPKDMEIYQLFDKIFKIIILKKISEPQENTDT